MRITYRVLLATACSSLVLASSTAIFCALEIFQCKVGSGIEWTKAIGPVLMLCAIVLVCSASIVAFAALIAKVITRTHGLLRALSFVVGGAIAGFVPRVLWEVIEGSFSSGFYPNWDYIPFGIAGIAAMAVLTARKLDGPADTPQN